MTGKHSAPELAFREVTKRYGAATALADLTMDVAPGSFTVLLGPSGSGKSTLLRCTAGIEQVSQGSITIGGQVVASDRAHVPPDRRRLAMVFQEYALWPHMTAAANVGFSLRRLRLGRQQVRERVSEILDRVGLAGFEDRYPTDLSGGEQQRVALARALVGKPGLVLFDEPLSSVDADLRERLRVEIATLTREAGATAVYITHDQGEAFALADCVGVLRDGRLSQYGSAEAIYEHPASPFVARFTGLAGELAGTVLRGPGGLLGVRFRGNTVLGRPAGAVPLGDGPARVLIRPSAVTITSADAAADAGVHAAGVHAEGGEQVGILPGAVVDVAFRGRGYDHVVAVPGGNLLMGVFDTRRHGRGTSVALELRPEGCLIFSEAEATARVDLRQDAEEPAPIRGGDGAAGQEKRHDPEQAIVASTRFT